MLSVGSIFQLDDIKILSLSHYNSGTRLAAHVVDNIYLNMNLSELSPKILVTVRASSAYVKIAKSS